MTKLSTYRRAWELLQNDNLERKRHVSRQVPWLIASKQNQNIGPLGSGTTFRRLIFGFASRAAGISAPGPGLPVGHGDTATQPKVHRTLLGSSLELSAPRAVIALNRAGALFQPTSARRSALVLMVAKFEKVSDIAYGNTIRSP